MMTSRRIIFGTLFALLIAGVSITGTIWAMRLRRGQLPAEAAPPVTHTVSLSDILQTPGPDAPADASATPTTTDATPAPADGETPAPEPPVASSDADTSKPAELADAGDGLPPPQRRAEPPAWTPGEERLEDLRAVTDRANYVSPRWSPLGIDIAFTRSDRRDVFVAAPAPDSGAPRLIWRGANAGDGFAWNADGLSIRVPSEALGGWLDVLLTGEAYPAPNPENRVTAISGRIVRLATAPTERPAVLSGPEDKFSAPIVSPDGTWVVYRGAETGLYLARVDGGRVLTVGPGRNPSWFPDSSAIVFDRPITDPEGVVGGDIYLATVNGKTLTNLTRTPGAEEREPAVSPDGERIAVIKAGAVHVGVLRRPDASTDTAAPAAATP